MNNEQSKCDICGRCFGEMDNEPLGCEDCGTFSCVDCSCEHECEVEK